MKIIFKRHLVLILCKFSVPWKPCWLLKGAEGSGLEWRKHFDLYILELLYLLPTCVKGQHLRSWRSFCVSVFTGASFGGATVRILTPKVKIELESRGHYSNYLILVKKLILTELYFRQIWIFVPKFENLKIQKSFLEFFRFLKMF